MPYHRRYGAYSRSRRPYFRRRTYRRSVTNFSNTSMFSSMKTWRGLTHMFPNSVLTKLSDKWSSIWSTINPSTFGVIYWLNAGYDPFVLKSTTQHSPNNWAVYAQLYQWYHIVSVAVTLRVQLKYDATFDGGETPALNPRKVSFNLALIPVPYGASAPSLTTSSTTGYTNWENVLQSRGVVWKKMKFSSENPDHAEYLKVKVSLAALMGMSKQEYLTMKDFGAKPSQNPANLCNLVFYVWQDESETPAIGTDTALPPMQLTMYADSFVKFTMPATTDPTSTLSSVTPAAPKAWFDDGVTAGEVPYPDDDDDKTGYFAIEPDGTHTVPLSTVASDHWKNFKKTVPLFPLTT